MRINWAAVQHRFLPARNIKSIKTRYRNLRLRKDRMDVSIPKSDEPKEVVSEAKRREVAEAIEKFGTKVRDLRTRGGLGNWDRRELRR